MKKTDKQEILQAIQGIDIKIDGVERRLSNQMEVLAAEVHEIKEDISDMHGAMNAFSSETDRSLASIKALMVTKDYLDTKLADLHIKVVDHVKERVSCWKEKAY